LENELKNAGFTRGFVYSSNIGEFTSDAESCNGGCVNNAFAAPSFDFAQSQAAYSGDFNSYALAFYAQDTWRLHPRFSVNLGLRYEYFSVPEEAHHNVWNYDPVANGLVQQGSSTVSDQFGNTCGTVPTTYAALPAVISGSATTGFPTAATALPQGWNCNSS